MAAMISQTHTYVLLCIRETMASAYQIHDSVEAGAKNVC